MAKKKKSLQQFLHLSDTQVSMIKSYLRAVFASAVTMGIALLTNLKPEYAILIGAITAPLAKWADKTEKEYGIGSSN
jgi:hypothetical protein